MIEWVDIVNFAVASGGLVIALLGLLLALSIPYIGHWAQRWFAVVFSIILVYVASDLVAQTSLLFLGPRFVWLSCAGVFSESLFSSLLMPMLAVYLLRCVGDEWRSSPLFYAVLALWTTYAALLITAQLTDVIYYFTPDNHYHRGTLYPVLLVPPALLMTLNVVALLRRRDRLSLRQRRALAVFIVVPLACMLIQMTTFGPLVIVMGTSLSALVMFAFVLSDQVDAHVREREEATRRRSQVMALQMRPHFIYNVMTSIYYLCSQDPEHAQQVILDFTDYLRANFAAVAKEGTVAFAEELGHARAYLAVEQARFEDQLVATMDCPHTTFRVPPLTLQPLVENSVKHGVDPERPPLHVCITTRDEEDASIITVSDDGPGFDPAVMESGPASALSNIRERLNAMGATLSIASTADAGTVVTIRVPSSSQEQPHAKASL